MTSSATSASGIRRHRNRLVAVITLLMMALAASSPSGSAHAVATYRISFMANGGTGTMSSQLIPSTGGTLKKNTFARAGYWFLGWAKTTQGIVAYNNSSRIRPTASIKLYAKWLKLPVPGPTAPVVSGHTVGSLIWSDEFKGADGGQLDSSIWTSRFCGHDSTNGGGTCHNSEPQWYTPDAVRLDGSTQGNVVITTKRTTVAPAGATCMVGQCYYTSGRFDTQDKISFKYGYIETRIQMPKGGANWPAYWMLGDKIVDEQWPVAGEIDIAEQGGHQPWRNSAAVHYATSYNPGECCGNHQYQVGDRVSNVDYSAGFHTYGLAWLPDRLEFYVDGIKFWTLTKANLGNSYWAFNDYFFVIFDNATGSFGGDWSGWSQSQMTIDYLRAWKLDGEGAVLKH